MSLASSATETFDPTVFLVGDHHITKPIVLAANQTLKQYAVLGKVTLGAVTVTAASDNGGDGTPTAATLGGKAQVGDYTLICTAAASDLGTFAVYAPDGARLTDLTVGTAYASDHINLTVADGANDWEVGDTITVSVAAGSGQYKQSLAAAVDGSQKPVCILTDAVTVGAAETSPAAAYFEGEVNAGACDFGAGWTKATVAALWEAEGRPLYLRDLVQY